MTEALSGIAPSATPALPTANGDERQLLRPIMLHSTMYEPGSTFANVNAPFASVSVPVTRVVSERLRSATLAYSRGSCVTASVTAPETVPAAAAGGDEGVCANATAGPSSRKDRARLASFMGRGPEVGVTGAHAARGRRAS